MGSNFKYGFNFKDAAGVIKYFVRFVANGGSGNMADQMFKGSKAQALTKNAFSRTGYIYQGWRKSSNSGAVEYNDQQVVSKLSKKNKAIVNLYAIWKAITYLVRYNANGGSGSMADTTHTYDVAANLRSNAFSRTGYIYQGWRKSSSSGAVEYSNGASVKNLSSVQGAVVTMYAIWKAITYYVKYNANGGAGSMADTTHTYDVAANLRSNAFSRTGYIYQGWRKSSSSGAVEYSNGASVKNLSSVQGAVVTMYAIWKAITYYVKYNANGGAGSMADTTHTYDVAANLRANAFSRTGYLYQGWATSAGGGVAYGNGASVKNLSSSNGATVNLYAKWNPITYYVKYNGNGNTGGSTAQSTHTYDVAKALTANGFSRTNYNFQGWATSAGGGVAYGNGASVKNLSSSNGATVNLYAKWILSTGYITNGSTGYFGNATMYTEVVGKQEGHPSGGVAYNSTGFGFFHGTPNGNSNKKTSWLFPKINPRGYTKMSITIANAWTWTWPNGNNLNFGLVSNLSANPTYVKKYSFFCEDATGSAGWEGLSGKTLTCDISGLDGDYYPAITIWVRTTFNWAGLVVSSIRLHN